jgi:hypothetical protein
MILSFKRRMLGWGAIALAWALVGCEQVIDLDVGENERLPVFSFRMDAQTGLVVGTVSSSVNFFSPGIPPLEQNVTGWVADSTGMQWELGPSNGGLFAIETGRTWAEGERCALTLEWEGKVFETEVRVPPMMTFDSLEIRRFEGFFGLGPNSDTTWQVFVHLPPFPETRNVLLEYWVNGEYITDVTQSFQTTPDTPTEVPLGWNQRLFAPGEEVLVLMWPLSDVSYAFWQAVGDLSGFGGPGGVPGNPPNHWSAPALGHFTVSPVVQQTVEIPL